MPNAATESLDSSPAMCVTILQTPAMLAAAAAAAAGAAAAAARFALFCSFCSTMPFTYTAAQYICGVSGPAWHQR